MSQKCKDNSLLSMLQLEDLGMKFRVGGGGCMILRKGVLGGGATCGAGGETGE